ncbi:hypothetical protein [Gordonia desulfuricans]|uniref:hypothetical protein n=1 Tax=Gordonia desulfuricans TaxID=89051 RepID=UPI001FD5C478|nr:hypothetical protein [Gordonia desulfuricans]
MSALDMEPGLARSLRRIERRVLAEVPLSANVVRSIWAAVAVLACVCLASWLTSDVDGHRTLLSQLAIGLGVAAIVASAAAATMRRFGWCWLAAAISAIAVPLSVLGYWSAQTGLGVGSYWFLIGTLCHAVLVGNWVRCALPPEHARGQR